MRITISGPPGSGKTTACSKLSEKLGLALGPDSSRSLYMHLAPTDSPNYPDGRADDTHLKTAGAERVAALIINDLKTRDARLAAVFE